jgi:hypothetical protein
VSKTISRVSPPSSQRIAPGRPVTTSAEDAVAALLGAWLVGGFFMDAYAHRNIGRIESILTPWHAVLYTGFAAAALWTLVLVRRRRAPGTPWLDAVPTGYGLGLVGIAVYSVGAVSDLVGHILFGFEKGIAALISPTHLLIFAGVGLIALSPFRSCWARPDPPEESYSWFLPAVVPLTMVTALVCQVILFLTIFSSRLATVSTNVPADTPTLRAALGAIQPLAVGQILLTGLAFTAPLLLLLRRWRPPQGTMTLYFGIPTALLGAVVGFTPRGPLLAVVLTGVAADVLVRVLEPTDRLWGHRAVGMLVPAILSSLYLLSLQAARGREVMWDFRISGGAILVTAIGGLILSAMIRPARRPSPAVPIPPGG